MRKRSMLNLVAITAAAVLGLAACAGPVESGGPITLTMSSWASGIEKRVAVWNAAHPDVQVELTKPGGNENVYAKLVAATHADEAPDIAQIEYSVMPSMVTGQVARDVSAYFAPYAEKFGEGARRLVTFDGVVYGVPQDLGPMLMLYRHDKFAEYGLEVPTTWAEFAAVAEQLHEKAPDVELANLSSNDANIFSGLVQQAGGNWWEVDGEAWTVSVDSPQTRQVADFWQDLADRELIGTLPSATPEYNEAVASGRILALVTGVWGPGPTAGIAPDTAGNWAAARTPAWTPGDHTVGFIGGSSNIVTTSSDHPAEAAEFVLWLNASDEGAAGLTEINKFPAATHGQQVPRTPPTLMPDDESYWPLAAEIAQETFDVRWGPNTQVAFTAFGDELGEAIGNGSSWSDALGGVQRVVADNLTRIGYTVAG
ncbi:ABC transporter substrate-binding protein [Pseudonocardia sp. MH-G8]|uniref:ABC transporter substrate-binding protein n=1 Tax=Pseudonocardia sp. MH-G8 TaxID=1854588 RepID=UPI000B9F9B90|nr:extracellular solute-binding protein [Pseudonocardia sp. MH-G8]OZM75800.1 sugar ABC transporter substrate-binding protein [Pseudonocardia sp. MH-G8]